MCNEKVKLSSYFPFQLYDAYCKITEGYVKEMVPFIPGTGNK